MGSVWFLLKNPRLLGVPPSSPQNTLAKVEESSMRKYEISLERQPLILHYDRDVQPMREHGKPRSEVHIRNADAGDEGRGV